MVKKMVNPQEVIRGDVASRADFYGAVVHFKLLIHQVRDQRFISGSYSGSMGICGDVHFQKALKVSI